MIVLFTFYVLIRSLGGFYKSTQKGVGFGQPFAPVLA